MSKLNSIQTVRKTIHQPTNTSNSPLPVVKQFGPKKPVKDNPAAPKDAMAMMWTD